MNPKEKAELIFKEHYLILDNVYWHRKELAIKHAICTVENIIKSLRKTIPEIGFAKGYWFEVKKELHKMLDNI